MFGTGYQTQSGPEADGACWLEEVLRREAAFEEGRLRDVCAVLDSSPFDSRPLTPCLHYGASLHTEVQFRYGVERTFNSAF